MAVYGISKYGQEFYGYDFPPDFRVDPFSAVVSDYSSITLSWTKPAGTIQAYRLIRNLYGYPVDQDDGEILIDSLDYPGSLYVDSDIVQGTYYYYGIYIATDLDTFSWVRSGLVACLSIKNFDSYTQMYDLIPNFYINQSATGDILVEGNQGNTELQRYMQVFGWGLDLLKTQYDTYLRVNDPWKIPQSDLYNLAAEFGLNINPDIHPYTLRKAIFNNAEINKQRGTPSGIATEVSSLTGWNIDLQIGPNFMLENDQSAFIDPVYAAWSPNINYNVGERTASGNFWYQCINAANIGNAPSGTSGSNTWWSAVLSTADTTVLQNPATGWPDTWEVIYPAVSNGVTTGTAIEESLGVLNPQIASNFAYNSLRAINTGSTQDVWLRSIARTPSDISTVTTTFIPDKYQAIADGIPVPYTLPFDKWNASTTYGTSSIVTYNNQPFQALRQSTGAVPPYASPGTATNEWTPISFDPRLRICVSAYCTGSSAVAVTPFVEWYDAQGNFISRVFARNPTPGSTNIPDSLYFDSFTTGGILSGRTTDDGNGSWTVPVGSFTLSPVNNGSVYPTTKDQRSVALISSGVSDTNLGVTFVTGPDAGQSQGIIFRSTSSASKYFRADWTTLRTNNSGVWTTLGTYSSGFEAGDRMVVQMSGTSITVLRNGVSVLSVTSSFQQTATYHGMIAETT